jgi:hypothetical protein
MNTLKFWWKSQSDDQLNSGIIVKATTAYWDQCWSKKKVFDLTSENRKPHKNRTQKTAAAQGKSRVLYRKQRALLDFKILD